MTATPSKSAAYFIKSAVGPGPKIEISEAEFNSLTSSVNVLLNVVDAEEKFDAIVGNYCDFERYIFDQSLMSIVAGFPETIDGQRTRSTTGRKLSNLLTVTKLYQDTLAEHAAQITGDAAERERISQAMSREYDVSRDYRIVCALRNSAQHNGSPVHGYMLGTSRSDDNEFVESAFEPHIIVADLARDPRFKKSILREIEGGPPRIDIKPLIRRFLERIFRIHREFRKLTECPVANAIEVISSAKARASQQHPDFPAALWAVAMLNDNGELQGDQVNLTDTLLEYVSSLRKNLTPHDGFSKRRVAF